MTQDASGGTRAERGRRLQWAAGIAFGFSSVIWLWSAVMPAGWRFGLSSPARLGAISLYGGRLWYCAFALTSFDAQPQALREARRDFLTERSPFDFDQSWWSLPPREDWRSFLGLTPPARRRAPAYPHFPATVWVDLSEYQFPLWIPTSGLFVAWLALRVVAWRRHRPGHCRTCGYNLTGNVSGRCSECGTILPVPQGSV